MCCVHTCAMFAIPKGSEPYSTWRDGVKSSVQQAQHQTPSPSDLDSCLTLGAYAVVPPMACGVTLVSCGLVPYNVYALISHLSMASAVSGLGSAFCLTTPGSKTGCFASGLGRDVQVVKTAQEIYRKNVYQERVK